MYEDCQTQVTTREGNTEYFNVKVGLHQRSAISPLLFIVIKVYKTVINPTMTYGGVPNVNIPETETIKLVRTYQEKRRRQLIKKNNGHGRTGEEKKRAA